jgi:hypothetical protein
MTTPPTLNPPIRQQANANYSTTHGNGGFGYTTVSRIVVTPFRTGTFSRSRYFRDGFSGLALARRCVLLSHGGQAAELEVEDYVVFTAGRTC